MPYKNIIYIKLFLRILEDDRWLYQCNERQQLLYLKLLLLAGRTANRVSKHQKWLAQKCNWGGSHTTLKNDITHLLETFPKFCESPKCYYFKEFKQSIPYISRNPKDNLGSSQGVPKEVLDKIRLDYIRLKGWKEENLVSDDYARIHKAIKNLFLKAKGVDNVLKAMEWVSKQGYCDWTMETVVKKYHNAINTQPQSMGGQL